MARTKTQQNQHAVRVGNYRQTRRLVVKKKAAQAALKAKADELRTARERKAAAKAEAKRKTEMARVRHQLLKNAVRVPINIGGPAKKAENKAMAFLRRIIPFVKKG